MNGTKITPMLKQYLDIKADYPDCILFYRMGDFYEMFFEDAKKAAEILGIALTSRNKQEKDPVPMCGVPVKAAEAYLAKLINAGCKVAICEQIEDPAAAKGLVKRDVVRIVTPGMVLSSDILDEKSNNFIACLVHEGGLWGLSFLDLSTGEFLVSESADPLLIKNELARQSPAELLVPAGAKKSVEYGKLLEPFADTSVSEVQPEVFEYRHARQLLLEQFRTRSLHGFGCEGMKAGIAAAGALFSYVEETQKQKIEHVCRIETRNLTGFLFVDAVTCRNLELLANLQTGGRQGSLLSVIDYTLTPMGGRRIKEWLRNPLMDAGKIRGRLDAVQEAFEKPGSRKDARKILDGMPDMERLYAKISMGHANARDMLGLGRSIAVLPEFLRICSSFVSPFFSIDSNISPLLDLASEIDSAIVDDPPPVITEGGMIKKGYDPKLDELITISTDAHSFLVGLEAKEREKTGIANLKVRFNKVFGYFIEVPKSQVSAVPANYVRKQTLVNAERYITDELKEFEIKIFSAQEQRAELEKEIFERLRRQVMGAGTLISEVSAFVGQADCILSLAEAATRNRYNRPSINTAGVIRIEDGRHPVIEKMLPAERFVPNSIKLDNEENQIIIITGPNMAGKSTVLRQVALTVLMAHMGSFVPALSADIALTDRIFTRIGALDNLSQGQSTFMVEMEETANIINNATGNSLVIMDEIGRGTSTFDGFSIAWAVAEYLHNLRGTGVKSLFATHYHELTELADVLPRVKNYNIAVKEWNDEIIFLHRLAPGATNKSYGVQVARLAGLPDTVIARAKEVLELIEKHGRVVPETQGDKFFNRSGSSPVQMTLFKSLEEELADILRSIEIENITPLEALNYLNELCLKARGSSGARSLVEKGGRPRQKHSAGKRGMISSQRSGVQKEIFS